MLKNYLKKFTHNKFTKISFCNKINETLLKKIKDITTINTYNGAILDLSHLYPNDISIINQSEDLNNYIDAILDNWEKNKVRSVTVTIPDYLSTTISIFLKRGFYYHHCKKNNLVLCKWIESTSPNKLPNAGHHQVGIGACILTKNLEFLLVKEKFSPYSTKAPWKFVTGLIEEGESIHDATLRETKEEVNLDVKYLGTILVSESLNNINKSDICFFSLCYLDNIEGLRLDPAEIAESKLFSIRELRELVRNQETTILTRHTLEKILDKIELIGECDDKRIIEECNLLRLYNEKGINKKHFQYLNVFH
jgi:ADP-ribose pyrophosphatase YjhB (NUDIX family)